MLSTCSGWTVAICETGRCLSGRDSFGSCFHCNPKSVLYVDHVGSGTDLFQMICDRDMEGVVAKQANARYTPDATTWVKIKNRHYSQAVERQDLFDKARQ
jgi:hypothetical protein